MVEAEVSVAPQSILKAKIEQDKQSPDRKISTLATQFDKLSPDTLTMLDKYRAEVGKSPFPNFWKRENTNQYHRIVRRLFQKGSEEDQLEFLADIKRVMQESSVSLAENLSSRENKAVIVGSGSNAIMAAQGLLEGGLTQNDMLLVTADLEIGGVFADSMIYPMTNPRTPKMAGNFLFVQPRDISKARGFIPNTDYVDWMQIAAFGMNLPMVFNQKVTGIQEKGDSVAITTNEGEHTIQSKRVILAPGMQIQDVRKFQEMLPENLENQVSAADDYARKLYQWIEEWEDEHLPQQRRDEMAKEMDDSITKGILIVGEGQSAKQILYFLRSIINYLDASGRLVPVRETDKTYPIYTVGDDRFAFQNALGNKIRGVRRRDLRVSGVKESGKGNMLEITVKGQKESLRESGTSTDPIQVGTVVFSGAKFSALWSLMNSTLDVNGKPKYPASGMVDQIQRIEELTQRRVDVAERIVYVGPQKHKESGKVTSPDVVTDGAESLYVGRQVAALALDSMQ